MLRLIGANNETRTRDVDLASRSFTTKLYLHGGRCGIRTHGRVTASGFQDQRHKPLDQSSIYGGRSRIRTYARITA